MEEAMKLWLIERRGVVEYEQTAAMVVRAESEAQARALATADDADSFSHAEEGFGSTDETTCVELLADGEAAVIIRDFKASWPWQ